jgi:hypothetical protein
MKPILIVPPEPDPPEGEDEEVCFSALEQPAMLASPPPTATPVAPRKPRLLRRP